MLVDPERAYLALVALAAGSAATLAILGRRLPRRGDWLGIAAGLAGFAIARALGASTAVELGPRVLAWTGVDLFISPAICMLLSGMFLAAAAGHLVAIPLLRGRPGYGRFFPFFWSALAAAVVLAPAADSRTVAILGAPFAIAVALFGSARTDAKPDGVAFARLLLYLGVAWAALVAGGGPLAAFAFCAVAAGVFPLWGWVHRVARGAGPEAAVALSALLAPVGIALALRLAPAPCLWTVAAGIGGSALAGLGAARAWDIRSIAAWGLLGDTGFAFALAGLDRPAEAALLIAAAAPGRLVALTAASAIAEGAGTGEACVIAAGSRAGLALRIAAAAGVLAPIAPAGAALAARGDTLMEIGSASGGAAGIALLIAACAGHGLAALGAGRILGAVTAGPPGEGADRRSWIAAAFAGVAAAYASATPRLSIPSIGLLIIAAIGVVLGALGERRPSRWCLIQPGGAVTAAISLEGFIDLGIAPLARGAAAIASVLDRHLIGRAFRAAAERILRREEA